MSDFRPTSHLMARLAHSAHSHLHSHLKRLGHFFSLLLAKQYTSIGGQAVLEGVMMRSPNAFIVAVRHSDGSIRLRCAPWFGIGKKWPWAKRPFVRGAVVLIETMANGVAALNYSANVLEDGQGEQKKKASEKASERVDWSTFLTVLGSIVAALGLFVFLPHALTSSLSAWLGAGWDLDSVIFHACDGILKAGIFLLYLLLIGLLPDIRRVFQYHGAEHMAISTFEAKEPLNVAHAQKFSTLHPRCGTTFLFFLIFLSILLFSGLFSVVTIGANWPAISLFGVSEVADVPLTQIFRHGAAIGLKVILVIPLAALSYELIKWTGQRADSWASKVISWPGLMLQKLTTRPPDPQQLAVGLSSLKAALWMEEQGPKRGLKVQEVSIPGPEAIDEGQAGLEEFLE